jgi:hypothetical protein
MLKLLCYVQIGHEFQEKLRELQKVLNPAADAWLKKQLDYKEKWALAYDEGGFRYGIMTTNASESFNRVFKVVRSLPVSGIVEYSFMKCNKYFILRWELVQRNMAEHGKFGRAMQEFLYEAEALSKDQTGEPYGPTKDIYNIRGKGGTALGGGQYGGRNYRVDLAKVECSCNVP